ncbi:hypothetical protein HK102_010120 [Quaeritorhiza haematococci]|nr:hypothetical protein HK102_010120 [Quaeritorhiza haematococci]
MALFTPDLFSIVRFETVRCLNKDQSSIIIPYIQPYELYVPSPRSYRGATEKQEFLIFRRSNVACQNSIITTEEDDRHNQFFPFFITNGGDKPVVLKQGTIVACVNESPLEEVVSTVRLPDNVCDGDQDTFTLINLLMLMGKVDKSCTEQDVIHSIVLLFLDFYPTQGRNFLLPPSLPTFPSFPPPPPHILFKRVQDNFVGTVSDAVDVYLKVLEKPMASTPNVHTPVREKQWPGQGVCAGVQG